MLWMSRTPHTGQLINENIIILMKFSSLAPPEFGKMTSISVMLHSHLLIYVSQEILTHWPLEDLNEILDDRHRGMMTEIFCETALSWLSLDLTDDQSTLVQVMAWCHQAPSHYLSQCWPRSMSPYGITRPQWVNILQKRPMPAVAWHSLTMYIEAIVEQWSSSGVQRWTWNICLMLSHQIYIQGKICSLGIQNAKAQMNHICKLWYYENLS